MSGSLIMKAANGQWYNYLIHYNGMRRIVEPILQKCFNGQAAIENILDTCGDGIKTIMEIPEDGSSWDDGLYDHSPDWQCSPLDKRGKAVAKNYMGGPVLRPQSSYADMKEAITATSQPNIYIWDGSTWSYKDNKQPFKRGKGSAWSRSRTN